MIIINRDDTEAFIRFQLFFAENDMKIMMAQQELVIHRSNRDMV